MTSEKRSFIDLSNIPRLKDGRYNWRDSVGSFISFKHEGITGEFEIVSYHPGKESVSVVYLTNQPIMIKTNAFKRQGFGLSKITGVKTNQEKSFDFEVGYRYLSKQGEIEIIEQVRKNRKKWYKCACLNCGDISYKPEHSIYQSYGCKRCFCGCRIGENDLATTHPELVSLFKNPSEASMVTKGSEKTVELKCPICGFIKQIPVYSLVAQGGFSCDVCSDKISYPEKFVISMLRQLDIEFVRQANRKTLSWSERFRYDFYIPSINTIIETHGRQHYVNNVFDKKIESLEVIKANDFKKEFLAKENGVEHYIVLDCSLSQRKHIENSIKMSKLNQLFDLNSIDWFKCEKEAESNLVAEILKLWESTNLSATEISKEIGVSNVFVRNILNKLNESGRLIYNKKEAYRRQSERLKERRFEGYHKKIKEICSLYNSGNKISDIVKITKISKKTVSRYLKIGNEYGYCNYNPTNGKNTAINRAKPVFCYNNGVVYKNVDEAAEKLGLKKHSVSNACSKEPKSLYGFNFRYASMDEYLKFKKQN